MLSKKYNYDNYIDFGTEYSKFNSENGLINIYDILTIRKQLPDELLTQLKRKHIQSEFSFKSDVQDDEVKYIKPKTKEEIIQERIKQFEELKKREEETREKLLVSLKQAEISKQIRDNIEREDQIRKITYEFNDWLRALCEVVHISRILKYDTDDLIETLNYVIDSIEEIDPKNGIIQSNMFGGRIEPIVSTTIIQSNMFGFKGRTYEDLLIMLSDTFKKKVETEVKEEFDHSEEFEEHDSDDEFWSNYGYVYDYESEEEDNVVIDDYEDDLGIYSMKSDRSKVWDSKRRKDNKFNSKRRFVNFREKKKQDGLKGGNLDDRKKIFYYLVTRFDESYDKHTDQNKQRIENILFCEAYICMYNDDSYINIELNDYKSHSVFDDVFENIVSIYAEKKDRKKKIYDRLFDENLYTYNLPYISRNNLLPLDHVKFIKEFNNRIKDKDKIKDYKKELYDRNKDRDDHFDKIVKIYKLYINTLDEGFIEKFSKELYDRNKDRDDQIDKIVEMYKLYENTLDEEFIEKIQEELYVIGKNRNDQIDKNVEMYKLYVNTLDEGFIEKIKKYDINFYNDGLSNLIRKNLTNMENYKKNSYILEVEGCNFNFLLNKLDVSYKHSFGVSHFYDKFIEVIKNTYKLTNYENKSKFYDECYIKLINLYDSTKYEVLKNVIEHYANPKVFNADIDKFGNKIIQKLYTAFKKDTKGYNLIKDYLKERIEYWIQNTNFNDYDRFFDYMKNYEKFTATLYNKMVTKLEKDHKEIKDLKTYFKLKIDQYKDNRFNKIEKVKEKLTKIIKETIPKCGFYIIDYYVDEQLDDFKTDIGNQVKDLITNYYTSLTADNFKIVNPNDEDSSTLNITAFNDKDYGLNQQFYKNNDNKAKINLWKDFEDCYRKCVVDKLTEIAAELSFIDVTYILFVLSRIQCVDESWINQILVIEKINETITNYLTDTLKSVDGCILYLTETVNINSTEVLKYFFCIDKITGIIQKICEDDKDFNFEQYEIIINNQLIQDEVKNVIQDKFKDKLVELFEKENLVLDDRIEEYKKLKEKYEVPLRITLYNKFKSVIGIDMFKQYIEGIGFDNFNIDKYSEKNAGLIEELKVKYKTIEEKFNKYYNDEKYKTYITKEIYETIEDDNIFIIDKLYYNYYLAFYHNNISNENLFNIIDYYDSEYKKDDYRKENMEFRIASSYRILFDSKREQNLTIGQIKKVLEYDNKVLFANDKIIEQFRIKIQKTIINLIDNISSENHNAIDDSIAFYGEIEKLEKVGTLKEKTSLLNSDNIKTFLITQLLNKFDPSIVIDYKILVEKYNRLQLSDYNQEFRDKFIEIIGNQINDKNYDELIEEYNDGVNMYFINVFKTRIVESMRKEVSKIPEVSDEDTENEITMIQERIVGLIEKYIKLYTVKYKDFKQVILRFICRLFRQLYVKSKNWNWINTYIYINRAFNLTKVKEIIEQLTLSLNNHFLADLNLQDFTVLYYISLGKENLNSVNNKFKVVEKYKNYLELDLNRLNDLLLNFELTPQGHINESSMLKYNLDKEMIFNDTSEIIGEDVNLIVYLYESMKERKVNNDFVQLLEELIRSKIKKEVFVEKKEEEVIEVKDSIDDKYKKIKEQYNLKEGIRYEFVNLISNTFNVSLFENKGQRLKLQTYRSILNIINDEPEKKDIVDH